jgi:hypothetical protein
MSIYTTDHVVDEQITEPRITHACVSVRRLSDTSVVRARAKSHLTRAFLSFFLAA